MYITQWWVETASVYDNLTLNETRRKKMRTISRRDFLKGSAASALGAALTGVVGGPVGLVSAAEAGNPVTDWITYTTETDDMPTFNILNSQASAVFRVLGNCLDGLTTNDRYGNLVGSLATSWESTDGGYTWTFYLRDDATWVDQSGEYMADVVAEDFIWGLEWVLNYWKNSGKNTTMPMTCIEGASEYYEYTQNLTEEEADALGIDTFMEMVGIEAPDEHTLIYRCYVATPYFATLGTYACLYPISGKLLENLGVTGYTAVNPETLWYNGPYIITEFIQGNEKVLTQNPSWWNTEDERFNSITWKVVESTDVAYQLYQTGEVDNVDLGESAIEMISSDPSSEFSDYMVGKYESLSSNMLYFNYGKKLEDGSWDENWNTAVGNTAFRLSLYYGLDLTDYLSRTNSVNPLSCYNSTISSKGLATTTEGVDYTELVAQYTGVPTTCTDSYARYDEELAAQYKAQAIEELTAAGVTFPVEIVYYVGSGNQTDLDNATVLKSIFTKCLGEDYVTFTIGSYVTSFKNEVDLPGLMSFQISGWGADYGDPLSFLENCVSDVDSARFSYDWSHYGDTTSEEVVTAWDEATALINEANAIADDMDARYDLFAQGEATLLNNALIIPLYVKSVLQLTHVNDYSKIYSAYGMAAYRMLNWETNADGYTAEDYETFAEEYEANRS